MYGQTFGDDASMKNLPRCTPVTFTQNFFFPSQSCGFQSLICFFFYFVWNFDLIEIQAACTKSLVRLFLFFAFFRSLSGPMFLAFFSRPHESSALSSPGPISSDAFQANSNNFFFPSFCLNFGNVMH